MDEEALDCEVCSGEFDELYAKTQFNGNIDLRFMCTKCFKEIHQEDFNE